ncbi:hypothetical protein EXS65_04245 [Candidatus Peribacteria bacterium]|nr:hypothetical protein [Candidatus Peribacteria bacterium]
MKQHCKNCSVDFTILDEDLAMLQKLSPVVGETTLDLPPPSLCPECRQQRRIAFRNDNHYYKNTCASCKKNVISIYSPDKGYPVYCHDCFWSDQWDGLTYGKDFDLTSSFFAQFSDLRKHVPRLCIFSTQSENSDYTVHSSRNKNCYMGSSLIDDEEVYFSDFVFSSSDSVDCFSCERMQLCYSCVLCEDCYNGHWLTLCFNVTDGMLCFDCKGSKRVLGCVGRRNASNEVLNEKVSPEEFDRIQKQLMTDSAFRSVFEQKIETLRATVPVPNIWEIGSENCTGNYLLHCKNVHQGYNGKHFEDCRYGFEGHKNVDCSDFMRCGNNELLYNCANIIELISGVCCNLTYQCSNMLYCDNCHSSKDCFGCFGIRNKRYCILNKQYTKEEYETLVLKIVEAMRNQKVWGEFFPPELSSFGYNESKANEWYPLDQHDALSRGWRWSEFEQALPDDLKSIDAKDLPDNIEAVPDDILNFILRCSVSGKPYRLIPQELAFYRKIGLPVPKEAPLTRMMALQKRQTSRTLHKRSCAKCSKAIDTTYGPECKEIVYCEECYLKTVY